MALSIGVHEHDVIYIGDVPLRVVSLSDHVQAVVSVNGNTFTVTDKESVEVLPSVMVSCGAPREDKRGRPDVLPRLLFDAPESILILRKELYERSRR